jgi:predicted RNA-binding Zn-ribbon protein involved in translation (DUF1610 family)
MIKTTAIEFRILSDDNGGYCLACGQEAYGVEPDARGYTCEDCGAEAVYGADECALMGRIHLTDGGE